jgi:chemotaxis protein CheD
MTRQRRTDLEKVVVGDMYDGCHRYYDAKAEETVVKIFSGGYYVTDQPGEVICTILGSCVAACIRDPLKKIGGMNHFLLPSSNSDDSQSMRYGAYAMELLINEILKRGADRRRLEVKVFGGARVVAGLSDVGDRNVQFVTQFLHDEELPIVSKDLGDDYPRRVHYYPETGRVLLRKLRRAEDLEIGDKEKVYMRNLQAKQKTDKGGSVDLFD